MTQEEFDSLVQRVTNALQGSSKMATDLRVVKSPIGVNLLPGVLSGELVALEAASLMGTDGKTPLFEVGSISSGLEADASIALSGTDTSGNPIYKIGLVLPKGDAGKTRFLNLTEFQQENQIQMQRQVLRRTEQQKMDDQSINYL